MEDDFYPLQIHDLSREERKLLIEIYWKARWQAKSLWDFSEIEGLGDFRRMVGNKKDGPNIEDRSANHASYPFAKWAALYNFAMTKLRMRAVVDEQTEIVRLIDELHQLGLNSGRYKTDMHLFNREHMFLNSHRSKVDPEFARGPYIGFRHRSDSEGLVFSLLRISTATPGKTEERNLFTTQLLNDTRERRSAGTVYQLGQRLFLSGFINGVAGAEFLALDATSDDDRNVLYGIINTMTKDGQIHAKTCMYVRLAILADAPVIGSNDLTFDTPNFRRLRDFCAELVDDDGRLSLGNGAFLSLDRHMTRERMFIRNTGR